MQAEQGPSDWILRFAPLVAPGARVLDLACDARTADLEQGHWPFAGERFDAIVVTNYLHRPLFPHLLSALAPDGVMLYETFAAGNAAFGKPSNPAFLLEPGELLAVFGAALRVIAFEDGYEANPRPAMVQRIAARRPGKRGAEDPRHVALRPS
jgi:SAM-dependent methyltransferase